MVDSLGAIGGNSSYGVGGYPGRGNGNNAGVEENKTPETKQPEQTQVKPEDVFAFLANNNYYVPVVTDVNNDGVVDNLDLEADPESQARIDQFMADFDVVYKLIADEFGEALAPRLVDMVMDRVMGF